MSGKKFILILLGFVFGSIALYLTWQGHEQEKAAAKRDAMVALFGGGGAAVTPPPSASNQNSTMFGSDFWKAGVPERAIDDSVDMQQNEGDDGILEKTSEGNPINPQTGVPFTDAVMEQFNSIRKKFPNNSIIPKRMSAEDAQQAQAEQENLSRIQMNLTRNEATPDEINQYYDYQVKMTNDRLELINYVLAEQGDAMGAEIKAKYTEVLDMNKKQLEAYEAARSNALGTGGAPAQMK